ncbi:sulfite exporter TauE/SafE family protein [Zoogloea sp.]|uniref:sulfite exporter TauE/SafE family protein n=1 Tax=Zoogloea sp. TaxID=49181 RepID=UPI0035B195AE
MMDFGLPFMPFEFIFLGAVAFFAGLVDAVVGGGGLIQIPVLLSHYPQVAIPTLFGTNKLSSIAGTSAALWRYARAVPIPWTLIAPAALAALVGAWGGAAVVAWLPREAMRPLVVVLMLAVAIYTFRRKDFGHAETRELNAADRWRAVAFGAGIGFYDGFFGPGTGSFLIFGFVRLFGMDFLRASASAKLINVATNVAAIGFFASHGPLLWTVGLVMAACNLVGAHVGTWLALRRGTAFVRQAFLVVVSVLIAKLAWEMVKEM